MTLWSVMSQETVRELITWWLMVLLVLLLSSDRRETVRQDTALCLPTPSGSFSSSWRSYRLNNDRYENGAADDAFVILN